MSDAISQLLEHLDRESYVADPAIATSIHLAVQLGKPLLVEGHAGVGKTEIAKVLARVLGLELIRLQCYEGLDASTALYEWNYAKQLLHIRLQERDGLSPAQTEAQIFGDAFLLKRPLLQAIAHTGRPPVLLIDEIDRSDEEFEAFLLEVLSDFQVSIPEIGTIRATERPYVILTSNRSRELSDALRRRCLYLWIDYPPFEKELSIVRRKVPGASAELATQVVSLVQRLRAAKLTKVPGVSETLDWVTALVSLRASQLAPELVKQTLGCVVKEEGDLRRLRADLDSGRLPVSEGAA
ncbi:MAG TPA: MoxR family ATPase [Myxococcaceae bacterium]|nr:MoxR family ATPase [Myxococcaceae bacterium]